jgi:Rod binding domain-containing protein
MDIGVVSSILSTSEPSRFPFQVPMAIPTNSPQENLDRTAFRKAATEVESFFLYYLLKTMRQAIPKTGLLHSKGGDTYLSLFDQEVANVAAKRGGFGLAKTMETQFFPATAPMRSSLTVLPPTKMLEEEGHR